MLKQIPSHLLCDSFSACRAIFGGSKTQRVVHRAALFDKEGKITHIISQSDIARQSSAP